MTSNKLPNLSFHSNNPRTHRLISGHSNSIPHVLISILLREYDTPSILSRKNRLHTEYHLLLSIGLNSNLRGNRAIHQISLNSKCYWLLGIRVFDYYLSVHCLFGLTLDIEMLLLKRLLSNSSDLIFKLIHCNSVWENKTSLSFLNPFGFECNWEIAHWLLFHCELLFILLGNREVMTVLHDVGLPYHLDYPVSFSVVHYW